ncbi:MAG TPA: type II secretion system F family protein [Nitrospiraceae bacterium]|nr:type II secretion system F family protein [Nitrospiraceae bacterium]
MPTVYTYSGRTKKGEAKKGEVTANSLEDAKGQLAGQGIIVTEVKEKKATDWKNFELSFGAGVSDKEIVIFTRQFATMINSGLPLIQCLDILASSISLENKFFGKAIGEIKASVEGGSTFADSLKKHPKVFDELYSNMVAAGEAGGLLDTILGRLATHMEKAMALKAQIKRATIYPTAIIIVAIVVISALMIFVIPTFAKMFADLSGGKASLPWPTELVIGISNFMQNYWYVLFGGGYGFLRLFKWYYGTPKGNVQIDALALKLPLMGDLIRKAAVAKFSRTLGTLISSGVPILEGLSIVAKTSGNKIVEHAIISARSSISEGKTVSEPLAKSGVFPSMVTQMIAVGEATGALDAMLSKIADFYDDEVDGAVEAMTAAMEPAIMMILGPIIGFVVVAMYLPIFKMASAMG